MIGNTVSQQTVKEWPRDRNWLTTDNQPNPGLQIMAGQRTMSGLIVDLTGQTPVLPVIFGYKHFLFNRVVA